MKPAVLPADPAAESAFVAAREICRRHARSFYFASTFLPKGKRRGAYAVYAFCRLVHDAMHQLGAPVDVPPPSTVAGSCCSTNSLDQTLALFRDRLDEIYDDRLDLPLPEFRDENQHALHAFALTVRRYEIPKEYFVDLAEGYRMDATIKRYATWGSLQRYCDRAGGVVARIMSCVFGLTHSDAHLQAIQIGNAMQLTTILRDLKQDWERGRLYLPLEDLARFGYRERDLAAGVVNDQFRELMRFEIARARELYRQGAAGFCWLGDDGSRVTAAAIAVTHSGILGTIERQEYDVFSRRARLTAGQKLRCLAPAWRLARRTAEQRVPEVFR